MNKDPNSRIGAQDTSEIHKHPWFASVDWEKVRSFEIEPPIKPEVKDKFDTDNFKKDLQKNGNFISGLDWRSKGDRPKHH